MPRFNASEALPVYVEPISKTGQKHAGGRWTKAQEAALVQAIRTTFPSGSVVGLHKDRTAPSKLLSTLRTTQSLHDKITHGGIERKLQSWAKSGKLKELMDAGIVSSISRPCTIIGL